MEGQMALTLIMTMPVLLIPAVFVWYLNVRGIYAAIREGQEKRAVGEKGAGIVAGTK